MWSVARLRIMVSSRIRVRIILVCSFLFTDFSSSVTKFFMSSVILGRSDRVKRYVTAKIDLKEHYKGLEP